MILLRNLVVAPLTEELAFRGLMVPALLSSLHHEAAWAVCLWAPLFFAVAHGHHVYERVWVRGEKVLAALLSTLLQLTYTSIFGAMAVHLLIRTGSLAAPLTSHVVCNFMGLPDLSFLQQEGPLSFLRPHRMPLLALHALGLIAYWHLVDPVTSSRQCAGLSPFLQEG